MIAQQRQTTDEWISARYDKSIEAAAAEAAIVKASSNEIYRRLKINHFSHDDEPRELIRKLST